MVQCTTTFIDCCLSPAKGSCCHIYIYTYIQVDSTRTQSKFRCEFASSREFRHAFASSPPQLRTRCHDLLICAFLSRFKTVVVVGALLLRNGTSYKILSEFMTTTSSSSEQLSMRRIHQGPPDILDRRLSIKIPRSRCYVNMTKIHTHTHTERERESTHMYIEAFKRNLWSSRDFLASPLPWRSRRNFSYVACEMGRSS